jgi:hypothetical protein
MCKAQTFFKDRSESFLAHVRAAMAEHYHQFHLIDKHMRVSNPFERPIYLKNFAEVEKWLFKKNFEK